MRHEFFGYPSEVNGLSAMFDFPTALATGNIQNGFIFPSNFKPGSIAGAAGVNLRPPDAQEYYSGRLQQHHAALRFARSPFEGTS